MPAGDNVYGLAPWPKSIIRDRTHPRFLCAVVLRIVLGDRDLELNDVLEALDGALENKLRFGVTRFGVGSREDVLYNRIFVVEFTIRI